MSAIVVRTTRYIERGVTVAAGAGLLALTAVFCADVIARYVVHEPIEGVFEMATTLFLPLVVFLGMALSVRADTHVRMTVLTEKLPDPVQRVLRGLGLLLGALVWGAIAWVVGERALQSIVDHEVSAVSFALPVFWGYLIVAVGAGLMALVSIINIGQRVERPADADTVEGV